MSGLSHPLALAAIALLLLNDHFLKAAYPGWITGKLSDVAGMVFFPLLVRALTRRDLRGCIVATGAGFTAVKLWEPATVACEYVLGALQWPFAAVAGQSFARVEIVRDPTDLIALPALAVAWWLGSLAERNKSPRETAGAIA